jgi:Tfp pilus assembly protein PilF
VGVLLVAGVLAVYGQILGHSFINCDDGEYITDNAQVLAGLTAEGVVWALTPHPTMVTNWHPLTWLSHMVDVQLYGIKPWGHFLTNLLLHAANSVLLFVVLARATRTRWPSALVAALFAFHPLHVESVAWAAERKDLLSTLFWMLTVGAYLWYVERPSLGRYAAVSALFALGLMAKPMLVTLPFVLLLLDWWPLGRVAAGVAARETAGATRRWWIWDKVPLLVLAAGSAAITIHVQKASGAVESLEHFPFVLRLGNAVLAYAAYLGKMVWPAGLAAYYPYPSALPVGRLVASALALVGISLVVLRAHRKQPAVAVGWLWYLGTLVPVIGLLQVGEQAMADRYTYVPLVGAFIVVVWGARDLLAVWKTPPEWKTRIVAGVACAVLATLMTLTAVQASTWRNSQTVYEHALAVTERNRQAHDSLGMVLRDQGRRDEALAHFRAALAINPEDPIASTCLGVAAEEDGRPEEAIRLLSQAARLSPRKAEVHYNLGLALLRQKRLAEALAAYRRAVSIDPRSCFAHVGMGDALMAERKIEEALEHYRIAVGIDPRSGVAHASFAAALYAAGRKEEARREVQQALAYGGSPQPWLVQSLLPDLPQTPAGP